MSDNNQAGREPIAIVGIGCRYPGNANDPESYWEMLCQGVDAVREIPLDRWDWRPYYDPEPGRPGKAYVCRAGTVEGIDQFDPEFFGMSPREAPFVDPQQRLLLEATWSAFEDAGQPIDIAAGSDTGVFVGISTTDYSTIQLVPGDQRGVDAYSATGSTISIAANRISYCFNFQGPSVAIDTACSSSLVAMHQACNALWNGECSLAITAGVNCIISPAPFIAFCSMGMLSPDGRCKAFDASANGFVRGEGVGAVLLKPLSKAIADGDSIYALIRSTAVNQDGHTSGMTVPSRNSQENLVREACRLAGVKPGDICYVEAHGTGTAVGDPIETSALGTVLGEGREVGGECVIGSVKTNIGHLEAGAGVAGLIKLALSLKHGEVPPNLHFNNPNPAIDFSGLKLRVPVEMTTLARGDGPLLGCINSFGFGGTNAHAILEAPPAAVSGGRTELPSIHASEAKPYLLPLTARGGDASLEAVARTYREFLSAREIDGTPSLSEICRSAALRQTHHEYRLAVVGETRERMVECLDAFLAGESAAGLNQNHIQGKQSELVFVFSGQGPQWWAMGRELLESEPVFREMIERCHEVLLALGGWSLLDELMRDEETSRMGETEFAQPSIFALQVSLAALWRSWGIRPTAIVGHSVGEVAAAYEAGVLDLESAMRVIYHRGRCMEHAGNEGRMIAAAMKPEEAEELIVGYEGKVSLAAINGPTMVSISGCAEILEEVFKSLEARSVFVRYVPVNYAFHSAQMDPVKDELLAALEGVSPQKATIPLYSTVSGELTDGTNFGADYWWHNVRDTVRFAPAIDELIEAGHLHFLEISAHPVLSPSVSECLSAKGRKGVSIQSLRRKTPEQANLLGSLGMLWSLGFAVNWKVLCAGTGPCVKLPRYPWQKESYWNESPTFSELRLRPSLHPLLRRRIGSSDPCWETELDKRAMPYLYDHRVGRHILLPAAGYMEMAIAAGKTMFEDLPFVIEEMEIPRGCVIPAGDEVPRLQLTYYSADSSFTINSKISDTTGAWSLNANGKARLQPERVIPKQADIEAIKARIGKTKPVEEFYEDIQGGGLHFGPHFQGVTKVWATGEEALGMVELLPLNARDAEFYHYHPAFLDSCFQVIGAMSLDGLLLPASIGKIRFHSGPTKRVWSHVRLKHYIDRKRAEMDLRIYDEEGNILLEMDSFVCTSAEIASVASGSATSDWLYQFKWLLKPLEGGPGVPRPVDFLPASDVLSGVASEAMEKLDTSLGLAAKYAEWQPKIDRLCQAYVLKAFEGGGWELERGDLVTHTIVMEKLGVVPKFGRLVSRLLDQLEDDGLLRRINSRKEGEELSWKVSKAPKPVDIRKAWREILFHFPAFHPELTLLERSAGRLAGIIQGKIHAWDVLCPGGSKNTIEQYEADSLSVRSSNHALAEAVAASLAELPEGRRIRILELGAGTGGLTACILPKLPAGRVDYVFTDTDDSFFVKAEQKFQDYTFVDYRVLDIGDSPTGQGFGKREFDYILTNGALHKTKDLAKTLDQLVGLLSSRGLVAMAGQDKPGRFVDLVFGTTDEWWKFEDEPLRTTYPLIGREKWVGLLQEKGFVDSAVVALGGGESDDGRYLLFARGAEVEAASVGTEKSNEKEHSSWLIFSDRSGMADELVAKLSSRGDRCFVAQVGEAFSAEDGDRFQISPSSAEGFRSLVSAMPDDLTGIIHAWSLDAPGGEQVTTAEIAAAEPLVCHSTLYLTQALVACGRGLKPQLWLVTRGAQPVGESIKGLSLAQSALCGLGRVILNEHGEFPTRMLDLDPDSTCGDADAIVHEILNNDGEEEIALRGEARYVQKLARGSFAPQRDMRRPVPIKSSPCRLETPRPGSLDSLIFRPMERRAPGPEDVEIEVCAAALNFRDVMKALGIYPAEADDAMLLGDECSGRIVSVGSDVKNFKVGDEVMAISAGCFSSHITTPALTVLPKPRHLSMEEATTMLVTYMTAAYALHQQGRMREGEKVLIHAATGGVGQAAVQVAMLGKAEIFATAGTPEKRDFLRYLGIDQVMDSRTLAFADEVLASTDGKGVDLVLNSLAGEAIHKSLSVLGAYGRFLEIGKRDIYGNTKIGLRPFRKNLSYFAIDLGAAMDPSGTGDLMAWLKKQFGGKKLPPLPYRTFPFSDAIEAFRYITQAKQVGKVVLSLESSNVVQTRALPKEEIEFRCDASYMISGGLGGFGLAVAEWLVEKGARNLVLTGRSGLTTDEAKSSVSKMEEAGAKVYVATSDISVPEDVSKLFKEIEKTMPPLGGVFHAAMVLDDGLITQLDGDRFSRAMTPKVNGAWNLHRETRGMNLDFFVMFSSVSSVVGSPGQANYVAANAFLDTLAHHRKLLGLPALVVNWGVLAEVGYVARHKKLEEHFNRMGWGGLTPSQVFPILGRLINSDVNQMVVLKVDWAKWSKTSGRTASSPRYSLLTSPEALQQGQGDGGEWLRNAIIGASAEERQSLMENYLREQIAKVLRTAPEKIEKDRPLNELGLDSLMAVELLHLIENQLSVAIPTGQLMGGPTVAKLAVVLVDNMTGGKTGAAKAAEPKKAEQVSAEVIGFVKDIVLDPEIRIAAGEVEPSQIVSPAKIFLTGALEFLGTYLLSEILGNTSAEVYCLVKGEDEAKAKDGIRKNLEIYGLDSKGFNARVHAVIGDIAAFGFGMDESDFTKLADEMDVIYHASADVNHISAYERLKPVNVDGTVEVIRFAGEGRRKPLHYVSSFTVLTARGSEKEGPVREDESLDSSSSLIGGYSQSRWVAERLLGEARKRGLPVSIYRPGLLSGDSTVGIASSDDFVWRLLKSCIEVGAGPQSQIKVLLTPVDFAAKAMFELSRNSKLMGRNFHLLNGESSTYSDLILLAGECGYDMELVETQEWEKLVVERGVDLRDNPLAAYLLFMPTGEKEKLHIPGMIPDLDNSNVMEGLASSELVFPHLDVDLMETYVNHFVRTGFFPPVPISRKKQTV